MKKVFFIVLVFALSVSFVWAFPAKASSKDLSVEELYAEAGKKASKNSDKNSQATQSLFEDLANNSKATRKQLSNAISEAEKMEKDYKVLKENADRLHPYTQGGVVLGLKEGKLQTGVTVGGGIRLKNGIKVGAQAQYMVMNTVSDKFLDNFQIAVTGGYDF